MKIVSFIVLIAFIGLALLCLLGCLGYIIYKFEAPAFTVVLGVFITGAILISIGAATKRII